MSISPSDPALYENYLRDLSLILFDLYNETSDDAEGYDLGRHMTLREIISVMQQQADVFQIPRASISLPDKDMD